MKLTRKILASLLALVMVMLMLPTAFAAEDNVYVMEASELEPVAAGDKADGDTAVLGTDGYFTLYYGAKTKVDSSKKDFEDGYHSEQRINFQGKTVLGETNKYCVEFTTSAAATIKLWWVAGGDGRQFHIFNAAGEVITSTTVDAVKNSLYISELSVDAAGTYYIGLVEGSNYLFKAQVTEAAAEVEPPVEPTGYAAYLQFCDTTYTCWTQNGYDGVAAIGGAYVETDAKGVVDGAGTYTITYTLNPGSTAVSAYLFYVEIPNAYEALKDMVLSDVHVSLDGTEITVNQNVAYVNPYDFADAPENSIYVYHSTVEGSTNNYVIELSNLLAGVTATKGAPIDLTTFVATQSISITFTLSEPAAVCEHANTEVKDAKAASCTEAGYTGDTYCADCGELIAAGEEIAVLEHTYVDGACSVCGAADPNAPVGESKTITINGATFTAEAGKWLYNTYVNEKVAGEATNAYMYSMIIFDKNYTGEAFNTNGYGAAIVLDKEGKLIKIYDGANVAFWTAEGKTAAHFTSATFATTAWTELQEGETLIIFPNDGASNAARKWALDLRGLNGTTYIGEVATLEGFTFEETPVEPTEPQPTEPVGPSDPSDTGDLFGIVVAVMAISGIALVTLKKKEN